MAHLSTKKNKAIIALLSSPNIETAAKSVQIGKRTLFRWLAEPDFKEALRKSEREIMQQTTRRLIGQLSLSIDTICEIRDDPGANDSVRLRAAQSILDNYGRFYELNDLAEIIARLEEYFDEPE